MSYKIYKLVDPMYGFDKYCKARSAKQAYTYFRYVVGIEWADISLIKLVETPETIVEDKPSITYSDGNNTIIIRENGYVIVIVDGVELERWKDNE